VVFLLSRISKEDRYKGYLNVIEAISKIKSDIPNIVFLIGGKTEESELTFIKRKIVKLNLEDYVKIIGYVEENEVIDHYLLSNVFAMPSIKEGFGIGFIEAAAAGISVIAGNEDGSKEALLNGELGRLINPNDVTQLTLEIKNAILNGVDKKKLQNKVFENYSFNVYLSGLERILNAKNDV
jgi:glycosyltransferase involved in cell wall biosynthesis